MHEKRFVSKILVKHQLGMIRDIATVRELGKEMAAKEFGNAQFQCSLGYLKRVERRNGLIPRTKTTTRQSTIRAYINLWRGWVVSQRSICKAYNIIKNGFIDGVRAGNLDEFALCPEDKNSKVKHISPANALMITADSLLVSISECKRVATIMVFAPMCGWKQC